MTLLTRGKKDVTFQIPDDTDESYAQYKSAVKHIAADRKDKDALAEKLSGKGFDGKCCSLNSCKRCKTCCFVVISGKAWSTIQRLGLTDYCLDYTCPS